MASHGDYFISIGEENELKWLSENLKRHFDLKVKATLGPDPHDDKHVRILNRLITYDEEGVKYEADPRHAEMVIQQLNLFGNANTKVVATPGVKDKMVDEYGDELLSAKDATHS